MSDRSEAEHRSLVSRIWGIKFFGLSLKLIGVCVWLLLLLAYLAFPRLVPYLIDDILSSNEIELRSAEFGRPGYSEIVARNVTLSSSRGVVADFAELRISYHPLELIRGYMRQLHVAHARISLPKGSEENAGTKSIESVSWPGVRSLLDDLPIAEIVVASLTIEGATSEPLSLTAFLRSEDVGISHRIALYRSPWGSVTFEGGAKEGFLLASAIRLNGTSLGEFNLQYPQDEKSFIEGSLRVSASSATLEKVVPAVPYLQSAQISLLLSGSLLRKSGANMLSLLSLSTDLKGSALSLSGVPQVLRNHSVRGRGTLKDSVLAQEIYFSPDASPLELKVLARHDLDSFSGAADLSLDAKAKDVFSLSARASGLVPAGFRVDSGTVSLRSHITWGKDTKPWSARLSLAGLEAVTGAGRLQGGSAELVWKSSSSGRLQGLLKVNEFNPGIPLREIAATFAVENAFRSPRLYVDTLGAEVLGGSLAVKDTMLFRSDESHSAVRLLLRGIDLKEVAAQAAQSGLEMSGSVDGSLPLRIKGGDFSIEGGELISVDGVIRYRNIPNSGNAALVNAMSILDDYRFDEMRVEVFYQPDGSLLLKSRLKGRNPGYQNGRQVNFSLNIEENVKSLLRSLLIAQRLERSVTERYKK